MIGPVLRSTRGLSSGCGCIRGSRLAWCGRARSTDGSRLVPGAVTSIARRAPYPRARPPDTAIDPGGCGSRGATRVDDREPPRIVCGSCHAPLRENDRYCSQCGARVPGRYGTLPSNAHESLPVGVESVPAGLRRAVFLMLGLVVVVAVAAAAIVTPRASWSALAHSFVPTPTPTPTPPATPTPVAPLYQELTFVVPPTAYYTLTVHDLRAGDVIEGSFTVTGGANDIDFGILDPSGGVLTSASRVLGAYAFHVVVAEDGSHMVRFGNTSQFAAPKTVTLMIRAYSPG